MFIMMNMHMLVCAWMGWPPCHTHTHAHTPPDHTTTHHTTRTHAHTHSLCALRAPRRRRLSRGWAGRPGASATPRSTLTGCTSSRCSSYARARPTCATRWAAGGAGACWVVCRVCVCACACVCVRACVCVCVCVRACVVLPTAASSVCAPPSQQHPQTHTHTHNPCTHTALEHAHATTNATNTTTTHPPASTTRPRLRLRPAARPRRPRPGATAAWRKTCGCLTRCGGGCSRRCAVRRSVRG
jgi:hypothetical protein